jgi:hypothetical protein
MILSPTMLTNRRDLPLPHKPWRHASQPTDVMAAGSGVVCLSPTWIEEPVVFGL